MGLRPLAYWDCGLKSRRGHGCLSLVSVVCCQVEVSATSWSLVQRSPTECGVSKVWSWSLEWGGLGPHGAVEPLRKKKEFTWKYEMWAIKLWYLVAVPNHCSKKRMSINHYSLSVTWCVNAYVLDRIIVIIKRIPFIDTDDTGKEHYINRFVY